jgi:peptide/nickel transport system substrate-binding protein
LYRHANVRDTAEPEGSVRDMCVLSRGVRALAVLIVAAVLGSGCAPAAAPTSTTPAPTAPARADLGSPRSGGTAIVAAYQEPNTLNRLLGTQTITTVVAETMVEGLVAPDPQGNYVPALAREIPSLENGGVSADGLTVTYRLREGLKWSDG